MRGRQWTLEYSNHELQPVVRVSIARYVQPCEPPRCSANCVHSGTALLAPLASSGLAASGQLGLSIPRGASRCSAVREPERPACTLGAVASAIYHPGFAMCSDEQRSPGLYPLRVGLRGRCANDRFFFTDGLAIPAPRHFPTRRACPSVTPEPHG